MPSLLLDDDEAVAVAVGLRVGATQGAVTGIEEAALRALAKLEQVLPSPLRRRVNSLRAYLVPLPHAGPSVDATTLTAIAAASRDHERLRFDYIGHVAAGLATATWQCRARVTVRAPAEHVRNRLPPGIPVEPLGDNACVAEVGSDTPQMLVGYLSMLDADFQVTEPPELVAAIRVLADRYRQAVPETGSGADESPENAEPGSRTST